MENIPKEVQFTLSELKKAGFEAYIVGGCVRDLIMQRTPHDWDIATSARPEQIQKAFPDSLYENRFGTVTVRIGNDKENRFEIQVTTYRIEREYSDKRHPDKIEFAKTLEEDLSRRDFTMNALALKTQKSSKFQVPSFDLVDLYNSHQDIQNKLIKSVGNPAERFGEDALRMMRAVRFASQLDFKIEKETAEAIKKNSFLLQNVSQERIRGELAKIISSDKPSEGIELLRELSLLKFIIPELEHGVGVSQNMHHLYTVYQHLVLSLKYCPSKKLEVRIAALLHDIAKPQTKRGEGPASTFYNHDLLGGRFTKRILRRLRFSNETVEKVSALVESHMFFYNVDEVSEAGVRRLVKKIGKENVKDLIDLRIADRLGSGVPKAKPYKLRHLEYMIEKVSRDPISAKMLKINGNDIMNLLRIESGIKIGAIMDVLLSEVLDDPSRNTREYLEKRTQEISNFDLNRLRKMAREKIEERKEEEEQVMKRKHWVK